MNSIFLNAMEYRVLFSLDFLREITNVNIKLKYFVTLGIN
ncbi:hypothetical protein SAMN04489761_0420 [Tenacibaculum sp. MAR_2009_124]|nr:hypothetical protein SAMN04489761_0420 [Tenacibaculum sp. MAR_2009_124]